MMALYRAWLVFRSGLFWLWSILCTLVLGGPVMLAAMISYELGYRMVNLWLFANIYGLKVLCGVHWRVDGLENIPDSPVVVMSKHQSTWETFYLPMTINRAVYVAKRSLARIPIFGWSLYLLRFILIDRASGRSAISQMVSQARASVALGRSIIVFPEGTRMPVGAEPNYRIGGAIVAAKTGTPVLPVALNAGQFWPRHGFIKWPGTITVSFGPPIAADGRDASDILAETQAWIEQRMTEITLPPSDDIAPLEEQISEPGSS